MVLVSLVQLTNLGKTGIINKRISCGRKFMSKDVVEAEGIVTEALPSALFKVELTSGQEILGHLSGKMRMNYIKVVPGDRVKLEMSPYDLTKGRITHRLNVSKDNHES